MATSLTPLLQEVQSALILLPQNPSLDEVAAASSLYISLDKSDQIDNVSISCPTPMVVEFNRIVGINKISQEVENKNLVVSLEDYPPENVERVSCNIVNQEFVLTIIPKPEIPPPNKSQLKISYSGLSADLIILVGGKDAKAFPLLARKENIAGIKLAHVGINTIAGIQTEVASLESTGSSVSEVVYMLLSDSNLDIDQDIATNLLAGIEMASEGFSSEGVTAETFEVVANLMRLGGRRTSVQTKPLRPPQFLRSQFENIEKKEQGEEAAPADWLVPRIYKGKTNI